MLTFFTGKYRRTKNHLIDLAGLGCALGYGLLAFYAQQHGGPSLSIFFAIIGWVSLLTFGLYAYFHRRAEPFPINRLIFWAVVFRFCGLLGGPLFEDDFYRYLWDGYRFAQVGTPYGIAPEHFFIDSNIPLIFQRILDHINYPEVPTIYGPTTQYVFLLGYLLSPGNVWSLQLIFIFFDLLLIGLLLRLAPAHLVLLYAWCPLVIKEIAFTAHPDGFGVCLLIAALVFQQRDHLKSAAVCLGLSVGAKVFALLLVPFILARANLRHWFIFIAVLVILYLPFLWQGSTDMTTLAKFAREWEFNAALFALLTIWLSGLSTKLILGLAFLSFLTWYYLRYRLPSSETIPRGDWIYGLFLIIAPTINAWYLIWLLPFAVIYPSRWAWIASVAIFLSYVTGLNLDHFNLLPYQQPIWVRPLEFGLIFIAFGYDIYCKRRVNQCRTLSR
jgi:hypothetical protein